MWGERIELIIWMHATARQERDKPEISNLQMPCQHTLEKDALLAITRAWQA